MPIVRICGPIGYAAWQRGLSQTEALGIVALMGLQLGKRLTTTRSVSEGRRVPQNPSLTQRVMIYTTSP